MQTVFERKPNKITQIIVKVSNVRDYFVGALFEVLVVFCEINFDKLK